MTGKQRLHNQCQCIPCRLTTSCHSASEACGGSIRFISLFHLEESTTWELWLYYKNRLNVTPILWLCDPRHSSAGVQPNYPSPNCSWSCQLQNVLQMKGGKKAQLRPHSRVDTSCTVINPTPNRITEVNFEGHQWEVIIPFQCLIIVVHIFMTLNYDSYFHRTAI